MVIAEQLGYVVGARALVSPVSARFPSQQLHLILGPNGAGKSTLLRLLAGQLRPSSGSVSYGGVAASKLGLAGLARLRSVLAQGGEVAFPLRVRELVMLGRHPHFRGAPGPVDEQVCAEVMELAEVTALADRDCLSLSGGERQRVQFARALAQIWRPQAGKPRALLLDEPLTFLDIHHQLEFLQTLRSLLKAPDLVVVAVIHDLNLAARFGDRLLLLHQGRLVAEGSAEQVLTEENVEAAFRVRPRLLRTPEGERHLLF